MNDEGRGLGLFAFAFLTEGMSSAAEDGLFTSKEECEDTVENFMLCSFAHHACSPLMQGCFPL